MAVIAARFIRANMPGTDVCLITDTTTLGAMESEFGKWSDTFSTIAIIPNTFRNIFTNSRLYKDTVYHTQPSQFKNESRSLVYELSPFDETLLLDTDYFMCNNTLSAVWGSSNEIMINSEAVTLLHEPVHANEIRINPFGIKMYWATAIYFKKGETAKTLFELVQYIRENWAFYKMTYDIPGSLFRNDYAFSIAVHILNGHTEDCDFIAPLPEPKIITSYDADQFYDINSPNDLTFFVNNPHENWKFYLSRVRKLNVHCMNKISVLNNAKKILEVLA